jgi:TolB-like protein/DNA-binding winged helix-turn-helix (wHTH) protein/Flp pilus assembly protein TadD
VEDAHPSRGTVRFSVFEVDLRSGELRKQGVKIRLQEQPFQLLRMLLERAGEVVTREELRQRIWPADTFVDFDQGLQNAILRLRHALGDSAGTPRFIETIPRRGYRFIGAVGGGPGGPDRIEALAVLPLENLSHDPEQEYFVDGLTEALITCLAKISALRVISRTTAMHYKGVRRPLPEIARELQVGGIVEGTVMRSGQRVRISAQLLDARSDTHLWAESYDRDLRDILALQSEVAHAIAREVQVKLTPQEHAQLAQTRPVDPQAYEAYLKGRYHWNKRSGEGVRKGAEYFQLAIEHDPSYAAAYAGLADCAGISGWWGFASPENGCGRAKAAALKALEMDPTLAEAHASLGWAIVHYDYDYSQAEKEFRRAIELNPAYATAHQWYGQCLGYVARYNEGLSKLRRALQLDPLSLIINTSYAGVLWFARRHDEAIDHAHKILELDSNSPLGWWMLGLAHESKGMYEPSITELQKAVYLSGGAAVFVTNLGHVYAVAGQRDDALRILEQLDRDHHHHYLNPYGKGQIYSALRELDEAFHWFDVAFRDRSAWMAVIKADPLLDVLRSDPRYHDLLHRMNFPQ